MFATTIGAVLLGYPVAFTLAGVGLIFATLGIVLGVFDVAILSALVGRYFGTMTNETLVAVPLFVFMGVMLERSKIAEALLTTMGELFGSLRGGLGFSVVEQPVDDLVAGDPLCLGVERQYQPVPQHVADEVIKKYSA